MLNELLNKENIKIVFKYFLISIIITFVLGFSISKIIDFDNYKMTYYGEDGIFNFLTSNDTLHYLDIAKYGYTQNHQYAFYPLYPILLSTFKAIGLNYVFSGLVLNFSCMFLTGLILIKLVKEEYKLDSLFYYFFSPITIYLYSIYTESLFIFLSILGWYLYKKKSYFLCSIFLGLSMLTRNVGYFLLVSVMIDFFYNTYKNYKFKNIEKYLSFIKLLIPASLLGLIYPIYTLVKAGDFFLFINVQTLYWWRVKGFLHEPFVRDFIVIFINKVYSSIIPALTNYFSILILFTIAIKSIKKLDEDFSMSFYLLSILIVSLSVYKVSEYNPGTMGVFRYIFGLFPIYIMLPKYINNISPKKKYIFNLTYLSFSTIITILVSIKIFVS